MRLGLNLLAVRPAGGVGVENFVRNVLGSVCFRSTTSLRAALPRGTHPDVVLGEGFRERHPALRSEFCRIGPTPTRILYEMTALAARFFHQDAVLSINNFGPLWGKSSQRRVVVIHDVWFLSPVYSGPMLQKWFFHALLRVQLRATHHVVTVSEFSRREIVSRLGVARERISVVPNCLRSLPELTARAASATRGDHLLLIGSDRPNKNVTRALEAYRLLAESMADVPALLLVGHYSADFVDGRLAGLSAALRQKIVFKGYVTREELLDLIATSRGVVFPSLYEGFGIPVIESVALGRPVLVSENTVCAELAGPMGVAVPGDKVAALRDGYRRLLALDVSQFASWRYRALERIGDCNGPATSLRDVLDGTDDLD